MSKLICENLTKHYGQKAVLENLNLTLESGKIYGLIGRNGAGKTTLLSIMSNQNPATSGRVTLDGENIWENRNALDRMCFSRELNLTPENGLSAYTVKKYLRIASFYYVHWDAAMADHLLKLFALPLKTKLGKLSKGMLSMLTITVALASKAEFTFLDEPVAGLDVVAREQFYQLLLKEYEETGRTFVISTHIIEEAASVLEDVIILKNGEICMERNTQELVESGVAVAGLEEDVDRAVDGLTVYRTERMGRKKTAYILLREGEQVGDTGNVTVMPLNLQQIFVALCGEEIRL